MFNNSIGNSIIRLTRASQEETLAG